MTTDPPAYGQPLPGPHVPPVADAATWRADGAEPSGEGI
jgi:hypothetical protein